MLREGSERGDDGFGMLAAQWPEEIFGDIVREMRVDKKSIDEEVSQGEEVRGLFTLVVGDGQRILLVGKHGSAEGGVIGEGNGC